MSARLWELSCFLCETNTSELAWVYAGGCVCMYSAPVILCAYVQVPLHVCAHEHRNQNVVLHAPAPFFPHKVGVSCWPGALQVSEAGWPASPGNCALSLLQDWLSGEPSLRHFLLYHLFKNFDNVLLQKFLFISNFWVISLLFPILNQH